jgi:hypothetical protein
MKIIYFSLMLFFSFTQTSFAKQEQCASISKNFTKTLMKKRQILLNQNKPDPGLFYLNFLDESVDSVTENLRSRNWPVKERKSYFKFFCKKEIQLLANSLIELIQIPEKYVVESKDPLANNFIKLRINKRTHKRRAALLSLTDLLWVMEESSNFSESEVAETTVQLSTTAMYDWVPSLRILSLVTMAKYARKHPSTQEVAQYVFVKDGDLLFKNLYEQGKSEMSFVSRLGPSGESSFEDQNGESDPKKFRSANHSTRSGISINKKIAVGVLEWVTQKNDNPVEITLNPQILKWLDQNTDKWHEANWVVLLNISDKIELSYLNVVLMDQY